MEEQNKIRLVVKEPGFRVREAVNTLRTNLLFSGSDIKTVAVTSTFSQEGKSTTSFLLAKSLAAINKKVVLLDCDIRGSVTLNTFQITRKVAGLTDFLSGQSAKVIYPTEIENLFMIFCGHVAPNPTEMLSSGRFSSLVKALREQFDYVIIDTPPIGEVVDAAIISQLTDGTIYVVRSDFAKKGDIQRGIKKLQQSGARLLGVALRGVDEYKAEYHGRKPYGYYSRYYGNRYEHREEDDGKDEQKQA